MSWSGLDIKVLGSASDEKMVRVWIKTGFVLLVASHGTHTLFCWVKVLVCPSIHPPPQRPPGPDFL